MKSYRDGPVITGTCFYSSTWEAEEEDHETRPSWTTQFKDLLKTKVGKVGCNSPECFPSSLWRTQNLTE